MKTAGDRYEEAFINWLDENRIQYVSVNQQKRKLFSRNKLKSFDFIVYSRYNGPLITELKGRKFTGTSIVGLKGLQCWVTREDVMGLTQWQDVFSANNETIKGFFVFAYEFTNIDVEMDGMDAYDFDGRKYVFLAVGLEDYQKYMKLRSRKWQTVFLSAGHFRQCSVGIRRLLLEQPNRD